MKLFEERAIRDAWDYAQQGGQALHLFSSPGIYPGAPAVFKRYKQAGHLFDFDRRRLVYTVRKLGVRCVVVSCSRTYKQHVDLCGKPLEKAKGLCEKYG